MWSDEAITEEGAWIGYHLDRFFHGPNLAVGRNGQAFVELDFSDQPPQDFIIEETKWHCLEEIEKKRKREDYHKDAPRGKKPKYWALFTNQQGFPADLCEYAEEVGDLVFEPPGYSGVRDSLQPKPVLCRCCRLRPCIVSEKRREVEEYLITASIDNNGNFEMMKMEAEESIRQLLSTVFGQTYVDLNPSLPRCATDYISNHFDLLERAVRLG